MTKEEAIAIINRCRWHDVPMPWAKFAFDMAIEALKAQDNPIICPRCGRVFAESEGRDNE